MRGGKAITFILPLLLMLGLMPGLMLGHDAAAQEWLEISPEESPLLFQPGGEAPPEEQHFVFDGLLPGVDGPTYFSAFIVEPETSQLEIFLERLGPPSGDDSRSLVLDEGNLEGRDARSFEYMDCSADIICARYRIADEASCAAFSLDESSSPDQWRPSPYDRLQGFYCTRESDPVSAETIGRLLANLSVDPRS